MKSYRKELWFEVPTRRAFINITPDTETGWQVINNAMQIMGGIGYTTVYPVERLLRDSRLALIWTGTNKVMNMRAA